MDPSGLLTSPDLLHPLIHALKLTFDCGTCLVLAAVVYRLLCPYLKGGR